LDKVNQFLDNIEVRLSDAIDLIAQDYDLGEDSDAARDYLAHHLDVLKKEELLALFGTLDITKDLFISKLKVERMGFYPDDDDDFVLIDVSFAGDVTDYLMAITFDDRFKLSYISMES
ncbi:MAG: DUF2004 domain-containing protein, partial [Thiovulaceae bacterium]|nr:DUF2004 domain-containing protein [Sulfurimonadaceae bacterium]